MGTSITKHTLVPLQGMVEDGSVAQKAPIFQTKQVVGRNRSKILPEIRGWLALPLLKALIILINKSTTVQLR